MFLMSLIGLSASAGTYYADLNVAVNPADLDEGDMVVMCHVNSKAFVGYDGSKNCYIAKVTHNIVLNNDPDHATGVEDVNAEKTVAGVVYYNLLGAASDRPFEGVNVVVTTYTDGTKSSKKIIK